MSISYNRDGQPYRPKPPLMVALMAVNVLFVLVVLSAWTYVSSFVSEPLAWATWMRIYRSGSLLDIFEYPFSVLWIMPLCFVALGWISDKIGARGFAWMCVTLPVVMHVMIIGWFHLAPVTWR